MSKSVNSKNTQLTIAKGYDTSRMRFSDPVIGSIPESKIEFKRINISTINEDGSEGELIIPTENVFSFGVSENKFGNEGGKEQGQKGFTFPLVLWNRDGPTPGEKIWTDTFNSIVDKCIDHVVEIGDEIDCYGLKKTDLTKFTKTHIGINPLYWKIDKFKDEKTGKTELAVVPGTGPTLYAKLIYSKKTNKFLSHFLQNVYNKETGKLELTSLDPMSLVGKICHTKAAVKIESVFIGSGSKISVQVKMYEAIVEPIESSMKRLLTPDIRQESQPQLISKIAAMELNKKEDSDEDDTGSLIDEEIKVEAPPVKVVKKMVLKKKP